MSPPVERWVVNPAMSCVFGHSNLPTIVHIQSKTTFRIKSPMLLEIFAFATRPRSLDELRAFIRDVGVAENKVDQVITLLTVKGLLLPESFGDQKELVEAMGMWRKRGWDTAALYHFFTKDFPFLDYSRPEAYHTDQSLMSSYKESRPEPARYKDYEEETFIKLGRDDDVLNQTSLHRLQENVPGTSAPHKLTRQSLGTLLYYTLGQIGSIHFPIVQPLLRRTSPSGGARHPTEGYLAVFELDDVAPGLYHYSVRRHGLELVLAGDFREVISSGLYTLGERDFEPHAIAFFTSVVERNMWRYREPRSYRVLALDVGHLARTYYLVALALGIRTFSHHGMNDALIEGLFGLSSNEESVYWYVAME